MVGSVVELVELEDELVVEESAQESILELVKENKSVSFGIDSSRINQKSQIPKFELVSSFSVFNDFVCW